MIDDYFGQENKSAITSSVNQSHLSDKRCFAGDSCTQSTDALNGKENMEATSKGKCPSRPKEKSMRTSKCSATDKKKGRKSKSLSSKKHMINTEERIQGSNLEDLKVNCPDSPAHKFSLKIRIKTKEKVDKEDFIEEFTSPEIDNSADDKVSELKSPQSTLFKYFIPQKSTSPPETNTSKSKVNRNISDFFSPSKPMNDELNTNAEDIVKPSSKLDATESNKIKKSTEAIKNEALQCVDVNKSAKKPRKKKLSMVKKTDNADSSPGSQNPVARSQPSSTKAKPTAQGPKSFKKSLSLTNQVCAKTVGLSGEITEEVTKSMEVSELAVTHVPTQPYLVADCIKDKFKNIMSKSSCDDVNAVSSSRPASLSCNKRKRNEKDDHTADCKSASGDSPGKSKRKLVKINQINCDSDDDNSTISTSNNLKTLSSTALNEDLGVINNDSPFKVEESKKNSLMKYFSKVSKEESLARNEKIEVTVKALVHSPPTTPSKKVKRRSVNSLPGGATSLNKKKGNLNVKLRENINAIEAIDVDETKSIITNDNQKLESCSDFQSEKSLSKGTCAPSPDLKSGTFLKTTKRISLRGKEKRQTKSTQSSKIFEKSTKDVKTEEEEETKAASPSLPQSSCNLGVCNPLQQLPSTQGTLLEEDSDNEEIFSSVSKKKRKIVTLSKSQKDVEVVASTSQISLSPDIIFEKKVEKGIKIAPLFTRKADSQARQLFLQSGVPDQVKRVFENQLSFEGQEVDIFPRQCHIQQKDAEEWIWKLSEVDLPLRNKCNKVTCDIQGIFSFKDLTGCCNIKEQVDRIIAASCRGPEMRPVFRLPLDIVKPILHMIKQESPGFMVVKTFQALKTKCRDDEFLKADALSTLSEIQRPKRKSSSRKTNSSKSTPVAITYRCPVWTEKYKPTSSSDIVGNGESVSQLKRWLEAWRKASEDASKLIRDDTKRKKKKKDFIDDDFVTSDNSSDSGLSNLPVGVAVLYGPNGSGKTSTVYALSNDMGFKVLEVNASEKRNGKFVLSKLSEATQSHQVQQSSSAELGFSTLFGKTTASVKNKKQKLHTLKRTDSDEEKSKKMSLILFEDVDIVFEEEDEGFLSAINNLVSTSKRPVILTTTDPESPLINRFMGSSNLLLEFSCPSNLQCTWLQILSLVEGIYVAPETVKDLVFLCKGDFRRALLQMQLWVMSGGNNLSLPPMPLHQSSLKSKKASKGKIKDDISDFEDEVDYDTPCIPANPDCISSMLGKNDCDDSFESDNNGGLPYIKVPFPLNLGLFWWNIPPLLSLNQLKHAQLPVLKEHHAPSGFKGMLNDSFMASFCTDDGHISDNASNEDMNGTCSQGSSNAKSVESQDPENPMVTCSSVVTDISVSNKCSQEEMFSLAHQMIVLSSIDIISDSSGLSSSTDVEPVYRFSQPQLKDSLALVKQEVEGPNFVFKSISEDIRHWLAEQTINRTRTSLCCESQDTHPQYNYCLPTEEELKWRHLHAKTEQEVINAVLSGVVLERQALATDYLPSLRTMCRLEKNKKMLQSKRNNRFYHHLKSLGANLTESMLELLCRTMCDF